MTPPGHASCFSTRRKRREYLLSLAKSLGVRSLDDWYRVTLQDFRKHRAWKILLPYNERYIDLLKDAFPEHDWQEWRFVKLPRNFFKKRRNLVRYLDWLGTELGFTSNEDWYTLDYATLRRTGGGAMIKAYGSIPSMLRVYRPDYDWKEWLFENHQRNFWRSKANERRYLDWLATELGFRTNEDWYRIKRADIYAHQGRGFLAHVGQNYVKALLRLLPERKFLPWRFVQAPWGFWDSRENCRSYLKWLAGKLGIRRPEDWYAVHDSDFEVNDGATLLAKNGYSPSQVVLRYYPELDLKPWLFVRAPKDWFASEVNRRTYLDWLFHHLGYKTTDDWYRISAEDFLANSGAALLERYGRSPSRVVREVLHEKRLLPWRFVTKTQRYWESDDNCRQFLKWLGKELHFRRHQDWYRITYDDFVKHGCAGMLNQRRFHSSPAAAVMLLLPSRRWNPARFAVTSKMQQRLHQLVRRMYPNRKVRWNYKHPQLRFRGSRLKMEFDVFVEGENLAFEYQGRQHYFVVEHWGDSKTLRQLQLRDKQKRKAAKAAGIRLVVVPDSWNGTLRGLRALMKATPTPTRV